MLDPNDEVNEKDYGNAQFSLCEFCGEDFEECTCCDTDDYLHEF